MPKTLYDILEVSRSASAEAIDASHQRLQADLQPKADAGSEDARIRLTAAREAYQTLSNPARRRLYDASLESPPIHATPARAASQGLYDETAKEGRSRRAFLIGVIVLGIVTIVVYRVIADQQAKMELQRIEKLQSIERERLALEQQRLEAARAAEEQRLELERQRTGSAISAREQILDMGRQHSDQSLSRQRAYDETLRVRGERERLAAESQKRAAEEHRQRQEQNARDRERLEAERALQR
ncbi:MAG: DnaJ domain-containing protein, partial [Burkholderiales bacterium]